MAFDSILKDSTGKNGIPQFFNTVGAPQPLKGDKAPYSQIVDENGVAAFTTENPAKVTGSVTIASATALKGAVQDVATAGTRVQLPAYGCREVILIAKKGNTGSIFVGGSDVSSTVYGVEMAAKESITLKVSNANLIYIDASVSGEGISYVAI